MKISEYYNRKIVNTLMHHVIDLLNDFRAHAEVYENEPLMETIDEIAEYFLQQIDGPQAYEMLGNLLDVTAFFQNMLEEFDMDYIPDSSIPSLDVLPEDLIKQLAEYFEDEKISTVSVETEIFKDFVVTREEWEEFQNNSNLNIGVVQ